MASAAARASKSFSNVYTVPLLLLMAISTVHCQHEMRLGDSATCSRSTADNSIKCWGDRAYCDPAYSGSEGYYYSPPDDEFDLGDADGSFTVTDVTVGAQHVCALSDGGSVRCWGENTNGQLGYSNTFRFSNSNNYGHDVALGTDVNVQLIKAGDDFTCVLTTDGYVKCWGINTDGQLGKGDTTTRGDADGTMGDDLGIATLGTDHNGDVTEICVGGSHACALNSAGDIKCWGKNDRGQLGQGDTDNRGDAGGEMGNHLDPIDFGSSFTPNKVVCGQDHSCAVNSDGDIKCWGMLMDAIFCIISLAVSMHRIQ